MLIDQIAPTPWDDRRDLIIPGDEPATIAFCIKHFVTTAQKAIEKHDHFFVALSGGTTPKAMFAEITKPPYSEAIDWSKVHLFWSDERSVPPDHPDSNYKMAMDSGFASLPIPEKNIHRMKAEKDILEAAQVYEKEIRKTLHHHPFDLVMLGMGEDGHTASLFPHTEALEITGRLAVANHVPQKNTHRMTLTFECINQARNIAIYVLGPKKKHVIAEVLSSPPQFANLPAQRVGTPTHKALWITDKETGSLLKGNIN